MIFGSSTSRRRLPQVQELCKGQTLREVIKAQAPLKEGHAAALFRDIVKSVLHCHQVREAATYRL